MNTDVGSVGQDMTLRPPLRVHANRFWVNEREAVLGLMLGLLIIGTINVFSSSFVLAETNFDTPYFFLKRHCIALVAGAVFFVVGYSVPYRSWKKYGVPLFYLTVLALSAVFVVGFEVNGAKRWIPLGPIQFQPAEYAKIVAVVIEAAYIASRVRLARPCRPWHKSIASLILLAILIEFEPDAATMAIVVGVPVLMLWASNMRMADKLKILWLGIAGAIALIIHQPYRLPRVIAMLDPWADAQNTGYQVVQSLQAIGSGGLTGMGLGVGISKYHYLPEAHTDFAFAIWAQELGFLGVFVVLALYAGLAYYGTQIAQKAREPFGQSLALGLTMLLVVQAMANLLMVSGWFPVVGVPLPFISYGGSSLTASLLAVGILLNIGKSQDEGRKHPTDGKSANTKGAVVPPPSMPPMPTMPQLRRIK